MKIKESIIGMILCFFLSSCIFSSETEIIPIIPIHPETNEETISIVTSLPILASITENVITTIPGYSIDSILDPGDSFENYTVTEEDITLLEAADIFIYFGMHIEPFAKDLLVRGDTENLKIITVSKNIELKKNDGERNVYFWLRGENGAIVSENIRDSLTFLSPKHETQFRHNTAIFEYQLSYMMTGLEEKFASAEIQKFLIPAEKYDYFLSQFPTLEKQAIFYDESEIESGEDIIRLLYIHNSAETIFVDRKYAEDIHSLNGAYEGNIAFISIFPDEEYIYSYHDHLYTLGNIFLEAFGIPIDEENVSAREEE